MSEVIDTWIDHLTERFGLPSLYYEGITTNRSITIPVRLRERKIEKNKIKSIWSKASTGFTAIPMTRDRDHYKFPVLLGIPGVGKTASLDYAVGHIFRELLPSNPQPIVMQVPYYNGHAVLEEYELNPEFKNEVSFAWRLFHQYFLEGRPDTDYSSFRDFMKFVVLEFGPFYKQLSVTVVLRIVRKTLIEAGLYAEEDIIPICLAVDEFQAIPFEIRDIFTLLLDSIVDLAAHRNIRLFPILAGTRWSKLSAVESSNHFCVKVAVPFLSTQASLNLAREALPHKIHAKAIIGLVATLGQTPRPLLHFLKSVSDEFVTSKRVPKRRLGQLKDDSMELYFSDLWQVQPFRAMLKLVAYSIVGAPVSGDEPSLIELQDNKIGGASAAETETNSWFKLASRGLVQLKSAGEGLYTVEVPLVAVLAIAKKDRPKLSLAETSFLNCVDEMIKLDFNSNLEPWQRWERFGAYYHAARINAFVIIGKESVSFADLFHGLTNVSLPPSFNVVLKPAVVMEANSPLPRDTNLQTVGEDENRSLNEANLMSVDEEVYTICINSAKGEGVDIFFVLFAFKSTTVNPSYLPFLVVDQRKREAKDITTQYCKDILNTMNNRIPQSNEIRNVIFLVFSALARMGSQFDTTSVAKPRMVAIYSRQSSEMYFRTLRHFPAVNLLFDPFTINKSTLVSLLSCSKEVATLAVQILNDHKINPITSASMLLQRISQVITLSSDQMEMMKHMLERHLVFDGAVDSDDDYDEDDDAGDEDAINDSPATFEEKSPALLEEQIEVPMVDHIENETDDKHDVNVEETDSISANEVTEQDEPELTLLGKRQSENGMDDPPKKLKADR